MADSTIISASLDDKELQASVRRMVLNFEGALNTMVLSTNRKVKEINDALKGLGNFNFDLGGSADRGSAKRTKQQQELTQEVKNTNIALKQSEITYDHIAQGIQAATKAQSDGVKKYTEAILKQARAIRESASWKETGHYLSSTGDVFYDKERASSTKREKEHMLSLEDQLVQAEQKRIDAERQASLELQSQTQAQNQLTQAAKGTQQIYESIQAMQVRSNKDVRAGGIKNTYFQNYEDFRMSLASVLGLQKEEIVLADSERASYEKLNATLKQLRDTYNRLDASERDSDNGKSLVASIQEVERSVQKIQKAASRPVDLKSALGLSEKTLDDIAYKMQMLQRYRSGLDTSTQKGEIDQVNDALKSLGKTQRQIMGENESLLKSNNALARSFNYMKNRLAFYFTVGAATQFVKQLIDIRSQYEMNERALGILIDSAEKGSQIFNELSQMSLVSPYTLIELTNAARQLTAYGVAARDVVDTTRRIADVAAAVGAPIERISYALGHIQSYGYLTSLQARQFANSGIPLVKELANRYSELEGRMVTTADVYDRMKKKQVEYADVMDVINRMTDEGGRFFDFQAKMADTLKVRLANLNLAWNNMLNDMGKSSQGLLTWTIGSLRTLFTHWKQLDQAIKSAAWAGGLIVAVRALNVLLVKAGANFGILSASMTTTQIAGKGLASTLGNVIGGFKALVTTPLTWWSLLAFAIVDAWRDLRNLNEAQKEFNKSLRDAGNNNTKSLTDFYNQYNGGAKKISAEDAKKVWEEMREQIELTVKKSDMFVGSLLRIDDVSKRLKVGFELINDINEVNAALKELDDDSIKMEADFSKWWNLNLLPDGLIENIQNYTKAQKELYEYSMKGESLSKMEEDAKKLKDRFSDLQGAISITTGSIDDLIKLKGWEGNINKINALYDQVLGNLAEKYILSPSEAFNMQMAAEKSRSIATEKALQIRLADERAALKAATDETTRYAITQKLSELEQEFFFFVKNTDKSRVYWRDFTNWIKTNHLSETQAMFKGMDAQQVRSLDFEKGKYFEWVDTLARKYAKEHKMTYAETFDILKNYITDANQMSIFIPLVIGSENKKTVYQTLTEADQAADAAWQKIERLNTRIAELSKNKVINTEQLTDAQAELTQAYQDYNDAIAKGGHSKKETTKDKKDQKAAESELQRALKEEIQLLDKARSVYKQLTKEGVESNRALSIATEGYEETITHINSVLQKYGIQKFNLAAYAGVQSPRAVLDMLQGQLDALVKSGVAKPEEIKDLQVKLKDIKVDAVSFDQKTLADSLNNELGKLKEEYELGVEFDANPELGGVFADMMGLSKDELEKLPRDFEGVVRKLQQIVDEQMGEGSFNVRGNLNKKVFEEYLKQNNIQRDSEVAKRLEAIVDYANKIRQDETKKQIDDWNKLLEKYAEYEYKRLQIEKDYQRELEVAGKKGADESVIKALENEKNRRIASLDFEQFQRSSDWIIATGNLAGLTNDALGMLIRNIEEYKKRAKDLSPKEIKQINNALKQLRNEQRKGNPFLFFKTAMEEMKSRTQEVKDEMDSYGKVLDEQNEKIEKGGKLTEEEEKKRLDAIENIKKLKDELKKLGKIDLTTLINGISGIAQVSNQAASAVASIASALGDKDTADIINGIGNVMNQTASMAATGAAIGGVIGAIGGGVLGFASGFISSLGEIISGNRDITEAVERSERAVKKLAITYSNLSNEIENTYGVAITGLKQAQIENKKLQLAETERQLRLEQSRKSKYRDEDKILDLKSKVQELRNEIVNDAKDIVNELLGISSAGDGITSLVDTMIEAFKNGEDAMEAFGKKWDEMIDNMIAKLIVSQYMQEEWDKIMEYLREKEKEFTVDSATKKAEAQAEIDYMNTASAYEAASRLWNKGVISNREYVSILMGGNSALLKTSLEMYMNRLQNELDEYDKALADASMDYTKFSIEYMSTEGKKQLEERAQMLKDALGEWFTFGENEEQKLSNLQQGISSISEDTATALEAYLNGISQQVYLQSSQLEEIKAIMQGWSFDVSLGTMGQMLLQLQNSYQVQMTIQNTLLGWSNATGMAMRVEMI